MIPKELCQQAIDKWGSDAQLDMVVEECAELIKAIQKFKRGESIENIIEEAVDVSLMIEQLRAMIPQPLTWTYIENNKIERLQRLLRC